MKVADVRTKHEPGILEIKSWYKTDKVEEDFRELFALNVHIFRWENGKWVQLASGDLLSPKDQQQTVTTPMNDHNISINHSEADNSH